jgi:hypothetical protein
VIAAELQHGAKGVGGGDPADRLRGHREDDMSGELRQFSRSGSCWIRSFSLFRVRIFFNLHSGSGSYWMRLLGLHNRIFTTNKIFEKIELTNR